MIDLIGIGALNLDCVASRSRILSLEPRLASELLNKFEYKSEKPVEEKEIDLTLTQMGMAAFETFLGGSAFNTIQTIASVNPGLKLGYVAVAGNTGVSGLDFISVMEQFRIDTSFVKRMPEERSGICISYMSADERSLLTFPGVNTQMSKHLKDNYDGLVSYLSRAKIIHVTSLFDNETPDTLLHLLQEVKQINPWLKLSFDPGFHWVNLLTPAVRGILKIADYLFLNNREFEILGHYRPGSKNIDVARRIFDLTDTADLVIILKQYDAIKLFYRIQGRILLFRYENKIIPSQIIEDATGAGDVFAGGFLTALLVPGLEISHGINLGLRLVRSKLLVAGSKSSHTFPSIFSELINELTSKADDHSVETLKETQGTSLRQSCVFLGHGRNPVWVKVATFLKEECSVPCKSFESDARTGQHVVDILMELLNTCNFAVMVLTADDETSEGTKRARQNVLHEIGLFQGRVGFNRVILLIQKGVEGFSNVEGVQYISFTDNEIHQAFYDLRRVLQREGIIS